MSKNQWFIVVGRLHGDYEATAHPIAAPDRNAAINVYKTTLLSDAGYDSEPDEGEEGEGTVYIDHVFACGLAEPVETFK